MSDTVPERMQEGGEIRERLARLENLPAEVSRVRERVHEIANTVGILQAATEDADDMHKAMVAKIDRLATAAEAAALASARSEAALGSTLAAHIEQCKTDKLEIRLTLADQNKNRSEMHSENQAKLSKVERQVNLFLGGMLLLSFIVPIIISLLVAWGPNLLHH